MLFSEMIDSIIGYIGETDPPIRRRFAFFFYEPTDLSLFFCCGNRKTQRKRHSDQKENHELNQKKRRNEREQDIYTSETPGGTPDWDHAPKAEFCGARG